MVCVKPGRKPRRQVFSRRGSKRRELLINGKPSVNNKRVDQSVPSHSLISLINELLELVRLQSDVFRGVRGMVRNLFVRVCLRVYGKQRGHVGPPCYHTVHGQAP